MPFWRGTSLSEQGSLWAASDWEGRKCSGQRGQGFQQFRALHGADAGRCCVEIFVGLFFFFWLKVMFPPWKITFFFFFPCNTLLQL